MSARPTADPDVTDDVDACRYELRAGERVVGVADYVVDGDTVAIVHTEIVPDLRNAGLASRLARAALDDLSARHKRVVPTCSYIAAYIRRHGEYDALVVAPTRAPRPQALDDPPSASA